MFIAINYNNYKRVIIFIFEQPLIQGTLELTDFTKNKELWLKLKLKKVLILHLF